MGWAGDNGDPDNFLTPQFSCASVKSGLNFARYCDPGLDKLIADGKAASSQEQRTGLYHQAQKLIHEQALWLPLAHPTAFALTRQEVQGYQVNPFGRQDFSGRRETLKATPGRTQRWISTVSTCRIGSSANTTSG